MAGLGPVQCGKDFKLAANIWPRCQVMWVQAPVLRGSVQSILSAHGACTEILRGMDLLCAGEHFVTYTFCLQESSLLPWVAEFGEVSGPGANRKEQIIQFMMRIW